MWIDAHDSPICDVLTETWIHIYYTRIYMTHYVVCGVCMHVCVSLCRGGGYGNMHTILSRGAATSADVTLDILCESCLRDVSYLL